MDKEEAKQRAYGKADAFREALKALLRMHNARLGVDVYEWLYVEIDGRRGWPMDNYALMCFNCNRALWTLGECPHKRSKCETPVD